MENTIEKLEAAKEALKSLPKTAKAEEKKAAKTLVSDLEKQLKKETAPAKKNRVKLKALNHLAGKYLLPYREGQTFTLDVKRAKELLDNKDAEIVK